MIGSLRGQVAHRCLRSEHQAEVLVEVSGVGYRVLMPAGTLSALGEQGSSVLVHVHTHVREDALVLYGFPTRAERECFELLLGAHGVGPSVALALLSVLSPAALSRAVLDEDLVALMLTPGIGKKTAQRLVLELRPRFETAGLDVSEPAVSLAGRGDQGLRDGAAAERPAQRDELRAALGALGYGPDEVRSTLARLPEEGSTEQLLRHALRELAVSS